MVYIDSKYDVILTYSPIIEITGHIFECFDYYLFLRNYFKVGILFFSGLNMPSLQIAWQSKYNVDFNCVKDDIIQVQAPKHNQQKILYKFGEKTIVMLVDGNYASLDYYNIILVTRYLLAFKCQDFSENRPIFHKQLIYLQDNRIYGDRDKWFQTINYVKKLPFKYYKKAQHPNQNIGMMYTTYICRKVTPDVIIKYHRLSGCRESLLIVPYALPEYDNIPHVAQTIAPVDNLFDKFDTYIYTPIKRKFDCSSRLLTECFMHGKKVIKQLDYYDVALETRYDDCVNRLSSLNLVESDSILSILKTLSNR